MKLNTALLEVANGKSACMLQTKLEDRAGRTLAKELNSMDQA